MPLSKRIKDASIEDIKKENESLYSSILEVGKSSVSNDTNVEELTNLKAEVTRLEGLVSNYEKDLDKKIKVLDFATKMSCREDAYNMIKEGKSTEEIYEHVAENGTPVTKTNSNLLGVFENTAPPAAGEGTDEQDSGDIKTYAQARDYIMQRDNCTKAEAARKARIEYPKAKQEII